MLNDKVAFKSDSLQSMSYLMIELDHKNKVLSKSFIHTFYVRMVGAMKLHFMLMLCCTQQTVIDVKRSITYINLTFLFDCARK